MDDAGVPAYEMCIRDRTKTGVFLIDPFVVMLKPAVSMSARPDVTVIGIALMETLLFLGIGLWMAKNLRYE